MKEKQLLEQFETIAEELRKKVISGLEKGENGFNEKRSRELARKVMAVVDDKFSQAVFRNLK